MMNNLDLINQVIVYIEDHLTEKIDCVTLARISKLSAYEFRRIFSFIIGTAPAEYIRRRRLSKSAMEIKAGAKVDDLFAEKYGYNSLQSFSRAFKDYYGVSTQQILLPEYSVKSFNPPSLSFVLEKDSDLEYTLIDIDDIAISAIQGSSSIEDTVCCESVWDKFNQLDQDKLISLSEDGKSYAVYANAEETIVCHIGIKTEKNDYLEKFVISGGKFLSFSCPMSATEEQINHLYEKICYRFLPSSPFLYDDGRPNVEVFPLADGEDFTILIPIKLK